MSKDDRRSNPTVLTTRRQVLIGTGATAGTLLLPWGAAWGEESPTMVLEAAVSLFCVYVDRQTGTVVAAKPFVEVNPEIKEGKTAKVPYQAPIKNVYVGRATGVFKDNIKRFAIVDIEKRNAGLGWFSSLNDAYTPAEYTLHFLLTLADRELARDELGAWALAHATEAQKKAALDVLQREHGGINGRYVRENPERMEAATRYYTGRELLRPMLFVGRPPEVGSLAMLGSGGMSVAALGGLQLAQDASGAVAGGVEVGSDALANDISAAAEGATEGTSAPGAAIGAAASIGAGSGSQSSTGDGGSGTGGGGSSGGEGTSCFLAGTRVWMADGSLKPIEKIAVGDLVASFDPATNRQVESPVTRLYAAGSDHVLDLDGLMVTAGHPFAAANGIWLEAGSLGAGSELVGADGPIRVGSITRHDVPVRIFNLTVGGTHTYFVAKEDRERGNVSPPPAGWCTTRGVGRAGLGEAVVAAESERALYLVHNKGASGGTGGASGGGSGF